MITQDQLEQIAIQWFQDTGWNYVHGAVIAPEGVAAELEDFRALTEPSPRPSPKRKGKNRLVEAVLLLNPKLPFFSRSLSGMMDAQKSSKKDSDHG